MKKNGDLFPADYARVTSILKPFTNLSHIDATVLSTAADRGTRVHKLCESHALNLFVADVDDDCKNYFNVFRDWFDDIVDQVLHVEIPLGSKKYKFCTYGVDLIAVLKGDRGATIIDYKTPMSQSLTWRLQTAAYDILVEECLGIQVERRMCVMLPKYDSKIKICEYDNHENDRRLFLNALELYRYFN